MSVLKKPLITEKLTRLGDKLKQYGFVVDRNATKDEIKAAIESFYNVEVDRINTMVAPGKSKMNRRTGQVSGRTKIVKKAIVKLKEGHSIDFFESI